MNDNAGEEFLVDDPGNTHESDDPSLTPKKRRLQRGTEVPKEEKPRHRIQKYRKVWETESLFSGWLFPVANDDTKARCSYCLTVMTAEKSVLKLHAQSKGHIKKFVPHVDKNSRKQPSVNDLLKQNAETNSVKSKAKDAEIKISGFFADRNIAFNAADPLMGVLKSSFPDSNILKEVTLNRKKVKE